MKDLAKQLLEFEIKRLSEQLQKRCTLDPEHADRIARESVRLAMANLFDHRVYGLPLR